MNKIIKPFILLSALAGLLLTGCKKEEGCTDETATNYDADAEEDDGSCEFATVNPCDPTDYCFSRDGEVTVAYGGQTTRLNQLEEMTTYMKTGNNGDMVSAAQLREMFSNNNGTGSSFFSDDANDPSKQLRNKTSFAFQQKYEDWMDDLEAASMSTTAGTNGSAGVVVSTSNPDKKYLLDANGVEHIQLIEKGLMGDCFYYQALDIYILGVEAGIYDNDILEGKNYTENEHKFDEAFGYMGIPADFATNADDARFHGKYCNSRNGVLGTNDIVDDFLTVRQAITDEDQATIEAEVPNLKLQWHRVIAGTAVHYLNAALSNIDDPALKLHELSEAYAFISNLVHSTDGYNITIAQRDECLALLGTNFWDTTTADINAAKEWLVNNTAITLLESADL
ncbi:MAG: DUF4856 domain-containing protein [Flavobacteriales bacterium]